MTSTVTPNALGVQVIDADSHVIEPPDLWTSRVPAKLVDVVPHVAVHPETKHSHWVINGNWLQAPGFWAQAGWKEWLPSTPWEMDEIDPASFDAQQRLVRMNEFGLQAQILYPNIIGFESELFVELGPEVALACTRAYNDFLIEWTSADPNRLIPIAMLPYWDRDAAVAEMQRCATTGHKGVLFANKFEKVGLPSFVDEYWDPVYAAAQDLDLAVNFHVGFSMPGAAFALSAEQLEKRMESEEKQRAFAGAKSVGFMSQGEVVATLVTSGLCDRFPTVKLVSVESGFGFIPYLLESLDWQWKTQGNHLKYGSLPSEIFIRQCYGTFWFEEGTLGMLSQYPDNFMYSTDFPHPTSMSPGPASPADVPSAHINRVFADIEPSVATRALRDNAAHIYKIPVETSARTT